MSKHAKVISTEDLKKLIDSQSEKYTLIDVREREELEHGMIPTAFNVPLSELHEALNMSPEDFKSLYGFDLPSKEGRVIMRKPWDLRQKIMLEAPGNGQRLIPT